MSRALCAGGVAIAVLTGSLVPTDALANIEASSSVVGPGVGLPYAAPRRAGMTPSTAETRRQAIREFVASAKRSGNWAAVADGLESNAKVMGDPVIMLEAGDARIQLANQKQDAAQAQRAVETTLRALDILYFYQDVASGRAQSDWLVIDPSQASGMISGAQNQLGSAQALVSQLQGGRPQRNPPRGGGGGGGGNGGTPAGPDRSATTFIAAGATTLVIGIAGAAMGIGGVVVGSGKQEEVERLASSPEAGTPETNDEIDQLNSEGRRANTIGYVGLGIAVVGLAVGIPLLTIGVKRRRQQGPSANARLGVAPFVSNQHNGLVFSGRF